MLAEEPGTDFRSVARRKIGAGMQNFVKPQLEIKFRDKMQKRGIDKAENKQSENAATLFTARCTLQMFEKNMMIPTNVHGWRNTY